MSIDEGLTIVFNWVLSLMLFSIVAFLLVAGLMGSLGLAIKAINFALVTIGGI